ncbi:SH3 domain-containing protein [Saccharopolyspora rosea]|nr:hypothetical protein [Saccharopolyspora rosea]
MDTTAFERWLSCLDVSVERRRHGETEELHIGKPGGTHPLVVLKTEDGRESGERGNTWWAIHERVIPRSAVEENWRIVGEPRSSVGNLSRIVTEFATGFPLVDCEVRPSANGDVVVVIRAPLFLEDLAAQAFLLTVSAVLKAAEALDVLEARKAEEVRVWADLQSLSEKRAAEQRDRIRQVMAASTQAPFDAPGADSAISTHSDWPEPPGIPGQQATRARPDATSQGPDVDTETPVFAVPPGGMHAWAMPDRSQECSATLPGGVQLRVLERRGRWAHVRSGKWSGWVEGRQLERVSADETDRWGE